MDFLHRRIPFPFKKLYSLHMYAVVLGIIWVVATVDSQENQRVSRKLLSSPDIDGQFSNEELSQLLALLQQESPPDNGATAQSPYSSPTSSQVSSTSMLLPELMRRPSESIISTSTTTPSPPVSRFTTRRFYRRLRRKTTTTEIPPVTSAKTVVAGVESSRALPSSAASPADLLTQISLLNGILGALNSTAAPSAPSLALALSTPQSITSSTTNATITKNDGFPVVPDFLAILTGAKTAEASTKKETVVPAPIPSAPKPTDDPAATLALLNLFSGSGNTDQKKSSTSANANSMANLLNLVTQASPQPPARPQGPDTDAAAALTKLLLQSSAPPQAVQGNSIVQSPQQSANQLNSLIGLLGTLGGAAGPQASPVGNINNLFSLGGDQVAQAQTNSLASLFAGQHQQPAQTQNLLNLFGGGGNQANQGLGGLASLLAPQQSGNSIPGLGILSTMSSLGSSIFSTVANIFGSQDGKPRVRGKGVDTRVGLGYRLGNVGDAQVVWDIGPQLFTDPLRNELRHYATTASKRESGAPAGSHKYLQPASTTATERHVQETEAKRRMVQSAIHNQYRSDQFASVYPKPTTYKRSSSNFDYHHETPYHYYDPMMFTTTTQAPTTTESSYFSYLFPFAEQVKGFWSGLTSGAAGDTEEPAASSPYTNFEDVRSDFSANLIKRSSQDYTDYESRAYHPRRRTDDDRDRDVSSSTLTDYEKMLLQYGKNIGIANTKHGVVSEPDESKSDETEGWFARWFGGGSSSSSSSKSHPPARRTPPTRDSEWDMRTSSSAEYPIRVPPPSPSSSPAAKKFREPPQKKDSGGPYGYDGSFNRRNENRNQVRRNNPRPQKRRSHNPFRNWLTSFRNSGQKQKARQSHPPAGFGRRHFQRPQVSGNPKLQHFTNTNKDLMMADANLANDEFMETAAADAGIESYVPASDFEQPLSYQYANEFPDVPITLSPQRPARPTAASAVRFTSKVRTSLSQREKVIEPALLYDHLQVPEIEPSEPLSEANDSFMNRNKVVVNPILKEIEKKKILGGSTARPTNKVPPALIQTQRHRLRLKNRMNMTTSVPGMVVGKQKIAVKVKGNSPQQKIIEAQHAGNSAGVVESTTALPSVLSTISSIFRATSKPKLLLNDLIQNATSFLPSISSIHILPRKKKKDDKTRLKLINGKPAIIGPLDDEDDLETGAAEEEPVVQVGEDMSFSELQSMFSGKNNTKRRRFRIRVKESVLKGETDKPEDRERKDSEEENDQDGVKDIFVDIESGEVSVLKPVASLISFAPKKEESSEEEEVDYYEDEDGDGVADADMKRREQIFDAIQKQLVRNFEKMKKAELRAEAKKRRKQELAEKGMDESIDVVTKFFDIHQQNGNPTPQKSSSQSKVKPAGGLSLVM